MAMYDTEYIARRALKKRIQSRAAMLRVCDGASYKELSAEFSVSPSTVRGWVTDFVCGLLPRSHYPKSVPKYCRDNKELLLSQLNKQEHGH